MRIVSYTINISTFILLLFILLSCASVKPEVEERVGIMGVIIPEDKKGEEIIYQERDKIVVNCIPLKYGKAISEKSFTLNPEKNGSFFIDLTPGEYRLEIFLKGFYVNSFHLYVNKGQILDMGKIRLQKIEVEPGVPLKGGGEEENILNEGDVNIQQPAY